MGENRGGTGWDRRGQDWYGRRERKGNEGGCTKRGEDWEKKWGRELCNNAQYFANYKGLKEGSREKKKGS